MNGRPFTEAEDAAILAMPNVGPIRLSRLLGRPYQSVRDRRSKLFGYEPPKASRWS